MKKIFISLFFIVYSTLWVNANSIDFYPEKDNSWWFWNVQVSELEGRINLLQDKTGLNTDIVILWKNDKQWCYTNPNFDNCVKEKYWYSSDIIIVLKMKSSISSKGDIRSYLDNKNHPIITTDILKWIQDDIVYNFWNNDFRKWILEYYDKLSYNIDWTCRDLLRENKNLEGSLYNTECKVLSLKKVYNENELLRTEAQKDASLMKIIYILSSIIIFIIFMIWMNIYYLWRLKKVLSDIKFILIDLDRQKTFKKDILTTRESLEKLVKNLEVYLANADKIWIKVRIQYKEINNEADKIKFEYNKSVENFNSQDELTEKIEDFKNINI